MPPPNGFYYIALFILWPLVAYKIFKRYSLDRSIILLFLVPYLFLPVPHGGMTPIKLPLFPPLDKEAVPVFVALALIYMNKIKLDYLPKFRWSLVFCLAFLLSPFMTVFANNDPLVFGTRVLPGLKFSEALSIFAGVYIKVYVPFIIGFSLLNTNRAHEEFIKMIFILGLVYSLIMVYEVRMSPQLHRIVYGYFPHDWIQQIRAGGFRPVAFLGHGLLVALYGCLMTISAFILWRNRHEVMKGKGAFVVLYFIAVLILCKTYSAVIYFLAFLALTLFLSIRMRLTVASVVGLIFLFYPAVRSLLPLSEITEFFMDLNPDRAASLQFRFNHEDHLLEKGNERPWFGWGTWGRNRIYDPLTGKDLSVTDGAWILAYGIFGWLGYIGSMGLLAYPVFALKRTLNDKTEKDFSTYTLGLVFILMIYMIDQIPNASLCHLSYLIAGAVLGRAKQLAESRSRPITEGLRPA
ncbi:hypothetical protein DWB84_00550 [Saccharophagus sp. K07]|nr:hypothetical protein [Saccharophagus sp. K07]